MISCGVEPGSWGRKDGVNGESGLEARAGRVWSTTPGNVLGDGDFVFRVDTFLVVVVAFLSVRPAVLCEREERYPSVREGLEITTGVGFALARFRIFGVSRLRCGWFS